MATITPAISVIGSTNGVPRIAWLGLATGDTVEPYLVSGQYGLAVSIQVTGTFGGGTVIVEQSNDGVNWFTLTDLTGNPISITEAAMEETSNCAAYLRPSISGGTADSIDVYMVFRG